MEFQKKVKNISLNFNNLVMPELGFGTHKLQGQDCISSIKFAIETGYRLIDTASVYKNEKEI
jgi:2,5-diketo-D-gluconate reductase A